MDNLILLRVHASSIRHSRHIISPRGPGTGAVYGSATPLIVPSPRASVLVSMARPRCDARLKLSRRHGDPDVPGLVVHGDRRRMEPELVGRHPVAVVRIRIRIDGGQRG